MTTPRQTSRSKSRNVASQPAAQQSSAQSMSGREPDMEDTDRERNALDNHTQGRHAALSMREEEDDDTATRH